MQAILSIPKSRGGRDAAEQLLFREIGGVPLLIRAIATASRAGAEEVLLIFPGFIPCEIVKRVHENKILFAGTLIEYLSVSGFDPASVSGWQQISTRLQDEFFWIPWNWVTNKHALLRLPALVQKPESWKESARA
jgi:hypothetical protein